MQIHHVAYSSSDGFIQHTCASIASVVDRSATPGKLHFHILDCELAEKSRADLRMSIPAGCGAKIDFIPMRDEDFRDCPVDMERAMVPRQTYFKLKLASALPGAERALYLDGDIIARRDVAELYETDFEDNYAAAVNVPYGDDEVEYIGAFCPPESYFNAGVILFNLDKIRRDGMEEKFFAFARENPRIVRRGVDQHLLNACLAGRVKLVPLKWNLRPLAAHRTGMELEKFQAALKDPALLHFYGPTKPWLYHQRIPRVPYSEEYFRYLKRTPYAAFGRRHALITWSGIGLLFTLAGRIAPVRSWRRRLRHF